MAKLRKTLSDSRRSLRLQPAVAAVTTSTATTSAAAVALSDSLPPTPPELRAAHTAGLQAPPSPAPVERWSHGRPVELWNAAGAQPPIATSADLPTISSSSTASQLVRCITDDRGALDLHLGPAIFTDAEYASAFKKAVRVHRAAVMQQMVNRSSAARPRTPP